MNAPIPLKIKRVAPVYTEDSYELTRYVHETEVLAIGGDSRRVTFIFGLVPLDCIDDVNRARQYNPRRARRDHKQRLIKQIADYGLVQPLVVACERTPFTVDANGNFDNVVQDAEGFSLYLLDGRHRYQGLLELCPKLKSTINYLHEKKNQGRSASHMKNTREFVEPVSRTLVSRLQEQYKLPESDYESESHAPLVPVKIYLDPDQVKRIGLAVFLNRGQKRLSAGEELVKVNDALQQALWEEEQKAIENDEYAPSEQRAVQRVSGTQGRDQETVVLSQFVTGAMDPDEGSPWADLIAKFQGDFLELASYDSEGRVEKESVVRLRRPLTAKNFLEFIRPLIDAEAKPDLQPKQRLLEMNNLNQLGQIFQKHFRWPDTIPRPDQKWTGTGQLCRSFLIATVGDALGTLHKTAPPLLSRSDLGSGDNGDEVGSWKVLDEQIANLAEALNKQAIFRGQWEEAQTAVDEADGLNDEQLLKLIHRAENLRGRLWSMATMKGSLKTQIIAALRGTLVDRPDEEE